MPVFFYPEKINKYYLWLRVLMTQLMSISKSSQVCLAMTILLAGCSVKEQKQPNHTHSIDFEQHCQDLSEIFNKSLNGFRAIREDPRYHNKVTHWQTRYHLIDGRCDIWQWSDKYSYICSKAVPDKQMADSLYNDASRVINYCLNKNRVPWRQKQAVLDNQGVESRYSIDGLLRGSLRKVNTGGIFRDSWTVYFRVDSPELKR